MEDEEKQEEHPSVSDAYQAVNQLRRERPYLIIPVEIDDAHLDDYIRRSLEGKRRILNATFSPEDVEALLKAEDARLDAVAEREFPGLMKTLKQHVREMKERTVEEGKA